MTRWWKEVVVEEGANCRFVQDMGTPAVEGVLVRGSREQAVERMLDSEIKDACAWLASSDAEGELPMTAEDEAEWRERWRPEMERRLAAALGEQE